MRGTGDSDVVSGDRGRAFTALGDGPSVLAPRQPRPGDDWQVGTVLTVATSTGTTGFTSPASSSTRSRAVTVASPCSSTSRQASRYFGSLAAGFDDLEVLTPGHASAVASVASQYGLVATPVGTIEVATDQALGDTVGILPAIAWLAVLIAVLAVVNTLAVNARQSRRELGLLRAVGLSQAQARHLMLAEAGLLGVAAAVIGVGVGCLLVLPMLGASSSPGFTPAFVMPLTSLVALLGGVMVAVTLAGVLPARRAAAADIVGAVRHE